VSCHLLEVRRVHSGNAFQRRRSLRAASCPVAPALPPPIRTARCCTQNSTARPAAHPAERVHHHLRQHPGDRASAFGASSNSNRRSEAVCAASACASSSCCFPPGTPPPVLQCSRAAALPSIWGRNSSCFARRRPAQAASAISMAAYAAFQNPACRNDRCENARKCIRRSSVRLFTVFSCSSFAILPPRILQAPVQSDRVGSDERIHLTPA
jgi:hypothetical protein